MQRLCASAAAAAPASAVRRIQADLACGAVSAVQVAQRYLDRLAEREPEVQSFITVAAESALDAAAALDRRLAAEGEAALGPWPACPSASRRAPCASQPATSCRCMQGMRKPWPAACILHRHTHAQA